MTSFKEQFNELTQLTQLYLLQEYTVNDRIRVASESFSYFKKQAALAKKAPAPQCGCRRSAPCRVPRAHRWGCRVRAQAPPGPDRSTPTPAPRGGRRDELRPDLGGKWEREPRRPPSCRVGCSRLGSRCGKPMGVPGTRCTLVRSQGDVHRRHR